ncbi:DUF3568 family protein [Limisphaera ngatamarikiensis]|uniref:DUF3568 family protein n=1 Tax=Limisphaera ngatamarikiensis TaxID=1324935 RepID=A0A6M1RIY9_9BACT|nr:DUF3568 family protein [Limisphaera ngatamarikiensis]NGO39696.1 DUF3568 family protein [Limisphaera ngatamarikiensis]
MRTVREANRWAAVTGALLLVALASSGCVALLVGGAAAAGAGTVAYVRGELQSTLDAPFDRAWTATVRALGDLGMPVTAQEKDGLSGRITARAAGDRKVTVQLRKVSGTATEVRIRVGTWGDEGASRQILEQIQHRL